MVTKETAAEKLARLKREREAAANKEDPVGQINHEADGSPNYEALAKKLEERKAVEAKGENAGHVKMTIYIEEDVAAAFNALITKRGQQKEFANQAFKDFILKKTKELGL